MPIDDALRNDLLELRSPPQLHCPECDRGAVNFDVPNAQYDDDGKTRALTADENFSPEDFTGTGTFRCGCRCSNPACEMSGAVVGGFTRDVHQIDLSEFRTETRQGPA